MKRDPAKPTTSMPVATAQVGSREDAYRFLAETGTASP
jgi:hypothetical protein